MRESEELLTERKNEVNRLYNELQWEQQRLERVPRKENLEKNIAAARAALDNTIGANSKLAGRGWGVPSSMEPTNNDPVNEMVKKITTEIQHALEQARGSGD